MPKVFISSTSRDLADYRQAAIDTCIKLGLVPIAMEHFPAMGVGATEGSKRELDKADVYVGIFAHRYGYIEDKDDGRSVTEIEFHYAGERGLDRLCFVVDPAHPWPTDAIDHENNPLLRKFKDQVNRLIRAQFTTVDNFASHLMFALISWKEQNRVTTPPVSTDTASHVAIAPPRPSLLIGREEDQRRLKLRFGIAQDGSIEQKRDVTIVHGWPGVGKTALVTALAYDPEVTGTNGKYPDGVLWANLGEDVDPMSELATWARALGIPISASTLEEMMARLRASLQNKRMLLIVDDGWRVGDVAAFRVAGPMCTTVITTRLLSVGQHMATRPEDLYRLGVLNTEQGLELLQQLAPSVLKTFPDRCAVLVEDLEGLPLALRVAGRVLESEAINYGLAGVVQLIDELRASGSALKHVAPDDRFDPKTGTTPTVNLLLQQSTNYLRRQSELAFDCYALLGAFAPKPATFDREAMQFVWEVDDPMPIIRLLVDIGLLEPIPSQGRFWMHALLVQHAKSLLSEE